MNRKRRELPGRYRMRKSAAVLILIAFPLSLLLAATAIAGPFEDIVKAFDRGDYETAYRITQPLAEKGSPKAQNLLGYMYQSGQGVEKDYGKAVTWYRKAADQGDAEAQNNVGVMYENGYGVWQDDIEAARWYRKAAEQGIPHAQNNLGIMYAFGKGVPQNYVLAYVWFNLAASRFPASEREGREQASGNRDLAAYNMTPAQLADAQRMAREWTPTKVW
ncbi:MAG: Sel1 protein repeat-containing protein [Deltaproteobacteria bacterium]|nr:Sel1 protein repeat-containing protein [Deltaproteobacteria bacterium]